MEEDIFVCVDADGTCFTHDYPRIGKDIGAVSVLKKLVAANVKLIIFTMRDKEELKDVVDWYEKNGIPIFGIQSNPKQKHWTSSPKAYGNYYIDDAAIGCPLILGKEFHKRPYVDWNKVEQIFIEKGILKQN